MAPKPIRIRLVATPERLTESVRHTLNKLDTACFPLDDLYPKDGCYWWLAYAGKKPVGFAGMKPLADENAGVGFLCRAGVLPEAEGRGLQRRLIRVRLRRCRTLGLTALSYTSRYNFASAANLLRCGMRFHEPAWEWGCAGAMYFEKTP